MSLKLHEVDLLDSLGVMRAFSLYPHTQTRICTHTDTDTHLYTHAQTRTCTDTHMYRHAQTLTALGRDCARRVCQADIGGRSDSHGKDAPRNDLEIRDLRCVPDTEQG